MKHFLVATISVVLLIGIVRFAIVASSTETGWETTRGQWQGATIGWFGLAPESIDLQEPDSQARYWMTTVDKVLANQNDSALLNMGAAWMLDSPGHRFMQHYLQQSGLATSLPRFGLTVDYEAIMAAEAEFEAQCHARCLFFADRATSLEPSDVRWWRMRGLLQFSPKNLEPRDSQWLATLDECSRHDVDNALYDYMAALEYWSSSAEYDWPIEEDWPEDECRLLITDPETFELGLKRFEAGLRKKFVSIGEDGFPAIAEFLNSSQLPKADQAEIGISRMVTSRQFRLFLYLWRWQNARADHAKQSGDTAARLEISRQKLKCFDQFVMPNETSAMYQRVRSDGIRREEYESLKKLIDANKSLLSPESFAEFVDNDRRSRTESLVLRKAIAKLDDTRKQQSNTLTIGNLLAAISLMCGICLGLIACCGLLIKKFFGNENSCPVELGLCRHVISWLIGCGVTFAILGMAPSELIARDLQLVIAKVLLWVAASILAFFLFWTVSRFLDRRSCQPWLRKSLVAMTGAAILATLWMTVAPAIELVNANSGRWLPARGWSGIDGEVLRVALNQNKGTWLWSVLQWLAHFGYVAGIVASLLLVAIWYAWLNARAYDQSILSFCRKDVRARWRNLIACVATSTLFAAIFCLTIYVWTAPKLIRAVEVGFQYNMQYCRDPQSYRSDVEALRSEIASSETEMQLIRDKINVELEKNSE